MHSWLPSLGISFSVKYERAKHAKLQAKEDLPIPEMTFLHIRFHSRQRTAEFEFPSHLSSCGSVVGLDHWSRCISTADCDSFKMLAAAAVAEFMKYSGALVKNLCAILAGFWPLCGKFYKNSGNPVTTSFPSQIPSAEKTLNTLCLHMTDGD